MSNTPKAEIEVRISRLQEKMAAEKFSGALLIQNSDLFYFSGTVQNGCLYVPVAGEPVLMVKKSLHRAQEESPLQKIEQLKYTGENPAILAAHNCTELSKIGVELDVLPFNQYKSYQKIFPQTELQDISPLIKSLRAIKSNYEISILRKALTVIDHAFRAVPSFLQAGMPEIEAAALFEAEMRRRGYSGSAKMRAFNQDFFMGNFCSGSSGFAPNYFDGPVGGTGLTAAQPQGPSWTKIERNEIVYVDYTGVVEGYIGDQTRIFCLGELLPEMVKAFADALLIQREVLQAIKPGTPAEEPYLLAVKLAAELGYQDHFMGYKGDRVKFIGHGIGLELDEWPIMAKGLKNPILPGMTFALEPKFVFPAGAIGTENSFVMTENGPEYLSITPEVITYIND